LFLRKKVQLFMNGARGFSLIEMAVAIFIITLLLASILGPLQTQVESRNYEQTQRILDQAREALIGYAAANGYFPCPASSTSSGLEAVGSDHSALAANTCPLAVWGGGATSYIGFLPAATLGFTPTDANGYAVDAWGLSPQNRIRYAVSSVSVNGATQRFTRVNGMRNATMNSIASTNLLYVCNSGTGVTAGTNCGTALTLTSNAIVVIWSSGANAATTGGASTDEQQNPNYDPTSAGFSADRIFVSRTRSGGTSGEFDDIVTWIAPSILFNRLIAAGQLP
jgi:prepilin-type N-terminal cleavage/methylation domain-containing protein